MQGDSDSGRNQSDNARTVFALGPRPMRGGGGVAAWLRTREAGPTQSEAAELCFLALFSPPFLPAAAVSPFPWGNEAKEVNEKSLTLSS
jgi:hypothetical protein